MYNIIPSQLRQIRQLNQQIHTATVVLEHDKNSLKAAWMVSKRQLQQQCAKPATLFWVFSAGALVGLLPKKSRLFSGLFSAGMNAALRYGLSHQHAEP